MLSKLTTRLRGVLALAAAAIHLCLTTETAAAFVPPSARSDGVGNNALVLPSSHPGRAALMSFRIGAVRDGGSSAEGDDDGSGGRGERDDEEFYESLRARMGQFKEVERDDEEERQSPEFGPGELERDPEESKGDDDTPDKSWLRPPQPISRRRPSLFSPDVGGGAEDEGEGGGSTPRDRMMQTESNLVSRSTSGATIALQAVVTLSFLAFQVFVFATGGISDGSDRFPDESVYMLTDKEVQALERVDDGSGPWRGGSGGAVSGGGIPERSLDEKDDGPIVL